VRNISHQSRYAGSAEHMQESQQDESLTTSTETVETISEPTSKRFAIAATTARRERNRTRRIEQTCTECGIGREIQDGRTVYVIRSRSTPDAAERLAEALRDD
jgi:predicted molibdopterin-dependent oxidoreductase YjgC